MSTITTDHITVPEAPPIAGLVFRRVRGEEDFPAIVEVINANCDADRCGEHMTVKGLASAYEHATRWDPQQDVLLVEVDGRLIGYANGEWRQGDDGDCLHFMRLHLVPEWRGRGLEAAIQAHLERRALEVAPTAGTPGARHLFACMASEFWQARGDMLLDRGYTVVRHFFDMERPLDGDLPVAELPAGLELRPALPEQYRAIWDANIESFRDHWGPVQHSDADFQAWMGWEDFEPGLWLVAWDGDQVAGASINAVHKNEDGVRETCGWVDDLYVRRPWRKRGLGRALLVGSLHLLKAQGLQTAMLGVDTENLSGALRLYESVGFRVYRRVRAYRKPMEEIGR